MGKETEKYEGEIGRDHADSCFTGGHRERENAQEAKRKERGKLLD